jgi:hypothetical protein
MPQPRTSGAAPAVTLLALLAAGAAAGCDESFSLSHFAQGDDADDEANAGQRMQLWTLIDIEQALRDGKPVAPTDSFPRGFAATTFLAPSEDGKSATIKVQPAFSEGEPAAYVATELWVNFREVWVQPWYFLVTAWNEAAPMMNRLKAPDAKGMPQNTPPLFDVGPKSRFYSPFWKLIYALVPADTPPDKYKSVEQLISDRRPLFPAQGFVYSVRPPNVDGNSMLVHPILGTPIGGLSRQDAAFVDGKPLPYFGQGGNNFRFDDELVVEEVPLFILVKRNANGKNASMGAPYVMGSAPLGSRRPAEFVAGRPRFGAYSRLTFAVAPATAAAFAAETEPAAVEALAAKMIDPKVYQGRVALDRACFAKPEFPMGCQWLDSQTKIEDLLGPQNLLPTEVTMCSALVFFGGKGIGLR